MHRPVSHDSLWGSFDVHMQLALSFGANVIRELSFFACNVIWGSQSFGFHESSAKPRVVCANQFPAFLGETMIPALARAND